jgi:voltage-gated potassium channel
MISRHRVWHIVEAPKEGERADAFDVFIMVLIAFNVIAVILQSIRSVDLRYSRVFAAFEVFSVAVFTVEYGLRLWSCTADQRFRDPFLGRLKCAARPLTLIDLAAILPFFVTFATVDLTILRAARLFRLVRLLKATRYIAALQLFRRVFHAKREELVLTSALMLVLLVMASSVMYVAENPVQPDKFSSIPASMWWAVATLTTVGYGDIYPVTPLGKLAAGALAILGIGFFALPTAIIGSGFVEAVQERKKPGVCPHCGGPLR